MGMVFHDPNMTHWCKGDCSTGWACTIEDGVCEGSIRCSDCLSEDLSSMSSKRADSYLDALERQSERG